MFGKKKKEVSPTSDPLHALFLSHLAELNNLIKGIEAERKALAGERAALNREISKLNRARR